MSSSIEAVLEGLDPEIMTIIDDAPPDERSLYEFTVAWPELDGAAAQLIDAVKVFLTTWDPLDWMEWLADARATSNLLADGYEIVLYAPVDALFDYAVDQRRTLSDCLVDLIGSVAATAAEHLPAITDGSYPGLASVGELPHLLDGDASTLPGTPILKPVSGGWQPIGLEVIEDAVQEHFGPVDLDRSTVRLHRFPSKSPSCLACAGATFAFPGELAAVIERLCARHAGEASQIVEQRFEDASASNPDGWEALSRATQLVEQPLVRLAWSLRLRVRQLMPEIGEGQRLADVADAQILHEVLDYIDSPAAYDHFVRQADWVLIFEHLMDVTVSGLAADHVEEAVALSERWDDLDPANIPSHRAALALALADSDHTEPARALVAEALELAPPGHHAILTAGEALERLGDLPGAEQAFRRCLSEAAELGDDLMEQDAADLLARLISAQQGRRLEARRFTRVADEIGLRRARNAQRAPAADVPRVSDKVGRNDPCPCGSGLKSKRCCGA